MKICPNCRNTYPDTGSFCNMCGLPLAMVQQPAPVVAAKPKFLLILNFIFQVFAIASATLSGCALGKPSISLQYMNIYDYEINSYSEFVDYIWCRIRPDEGCTIVAIVLASIALAIAISLLIYALAKQRQCKAIFSAVIRLLIGVGLFAVAVCFTT